jgi:tetratricopeptide (TPR) repeat protein
MALECLERFDEAIIYYDKAIKLDPNNAFYYIHKVEFLNYLERYDKAIGYFNEIIKFNERYLSRAYHKKAYSLVFLNRSNEAIECYDKAIELNPNEVDIYINKGNYLNILNKYAEAVRCQMLW